jgi:hypothetical protein
LSRACLPCPADGMQLAGNDLDLVSSPSSLTGFKGMLADKLLEAASSVQSLTHKESHINDCRFQWEKVS